MKEFPSKVNQMYKRASLYSQQTDQSNFLINDFYINLIIDMYQGMVKDLVRVIFDETLYKNNVLYLKIFRENLEEIIDRINLYYFPPLLMSHNFPISVTSDNNFNHIFKYMIMLFQVFGIYDDPNMPDRFTDPEFGETVGNFLKKIYRATNQNRHQNTDNFLIKLIDLCPVPYDPTRLID